MSTPAIPAYAVCRHRMNQDGDGVVTLVAVSGCPLRCAYCLNPEGRDASAPSKLYTPETLFRAVEIDDLYFQATGGGVTFGGGEPLMHADFLRAFIPLAKGKWKIRVETSLNVPNENIFVKADEFIADIKSLDESVYERYTGKPLLPALQNLKSLLNFAGPDRVLVRIPEIPGYTSAKTRAENAEALRKMGVTRIDEFTYRVR